jgi:hypothetical protein
VEDLDWEMKESGQKKKLDMNEEKIIWRMNPDLLKLEMTDRRQKCTVVTLVLPR